ncbi:Pimeloyl-ACP methyl ester carboxylesterase [Nonomuraea solani]|uniref:Pimeloyl-ACP methyl ester carboxylesterase n=1 Tax=Nonomuraea solani TaxID=1144553 RepID=A0A1H6E9N0_9ACTN|nr:alpha/beta hydrolase [Nonomuraea solani]SEG93953.1 Pimeloyl-ACP methyl ester carboxylesterase [Nonomuraea solani]
MNEPTRRTAFQLAAVAGAGAATTSFAAKRKEVTTFLFVTGSNGVATADPELTLRGHRALGVGLPGHGPEEQFHRAYQAPQDLAKLATIPSPVSGVTLDDYVEATEKAVRRAAEHGPVILVGGSLGGSTITKVADAVPDLVDLLVYDAAYCCTKLSSPAAYLETPEGKASLATSIVSGLVGDPRVLKAIRVNWRTNDEKFLKAAKAAYMADGTDGELLAMLNSLLPDESLQVSSADARGRAQAWGRVPRVYIRHSRDMVLPIALQDRMIREADAATPGNKFRVFTVEASHAPTAKAYARITEILHRLAK